MVALDLFRASRCPNCGRDIEECTAAESEEAYEAIHSRCHATTARLIAQDAYRENPHSSALMWATRRKR